MKVPIRMDDSAVREVERRQKRRFRLPAFGLIQAMKVTLRAMLSRTVTVHYPEERVELPERTRGVIALLEENCTVCMLCSKECPCWCIYIEGHKATKPGKRKPVNELDRFAIDYGLCMYCGICVEVCPFDALHWSPFFEYTSYTYEGMIHEAEVLTEWEDHVLPPPPLVADAEEKARTQTQQEHDKRAEGVWAVIREADKREAYRAKQSGAALAPPAPAGPEVPEVTGDSGVQESAGGVGGVQAAKPPERPPIQQAGTQPEPPTATDEAPEVAPAADTGDLPRVDPNNLPDGIGPVERGRLKKLAVFQERGQAPPADLVEKLRPLLDQIKGAG